MSPAGSVGAQTPSDPSEPEVSRQTTALIDSVLAWQYTGRQTDANRLLNAELQQCRQQGRIRDAVRVLNVLAYMAWQRADYVAADKAALEAVRLAKKHRVTIDLGDTYHTLGMSAQEQQEPQRAIGFLREALRYPYQQSYEAQTAYQQSLSTLGFLYMEQRNYPLARTYMRRALLEGRRVRKPIQEFSVLSVWAEGLRRAQPDTARILAQQALQLARTRLGHDADQARAVNYAEMVLMQIAQVQQRWPEVLQLGRRVVRDARQLEQPEYEAEAMVAVAQALRQLGQGTAAYDSLARSIELTDTLRSQTKAEELARTQARLGAVEQEARIRDLEQKRRITTLEADRARARAEELLLLAGGLALLLVVAAYAYWRLQQSKAALARSEARATAANETKDRLMSIIGHDLRGPVANFQQALLLVRYYADHPEPDEQRALADELAARAQRLSGLLDNLLFWGSSQRQEVRNHPERLELAEQLERVRGLYAPLAAAKGVQLQAVLPAEQAVGWADPTLVSTLLRNLVSNAIKFTPHGGEVVVEVTAGTGGRWTLTVRDTGVGLTDDQLAQLFEVGAKRSTRGTAQEPGTGLGLLVCRHFAELLGGELTVQSRPGQGAAFSFTVAGASATEKRD